MDTTLLISAISGLVSVVGAEFLIIRALYESRLKDKDKLIEEKSLSITRRDAIITEKDKVIQSQQAKIDDIYELFVERKFGK